MILRCNKKVEIFTLPYFGDRVDGFVTPTSGIDVVKPYECFVMKTRQNLKQNQIAEIEHFHTSKQEMQEIKVQLLKIP